MVVELGVDRIIDRIVDIGVDIVVDIVDKVGAMVIDIDTYIVEKVK